MVTNLDSPAPAFGGTKKAQALAARAFDVIRGQGMFMADNAPIRVPLDQLTAFLVEREGATDREVAEAIENSPEVFSIVETEGVAYVVTTRQGKAPLGIEPVSAHSLSARFLTPEPKVERPTRPAPERPRVDPSWATYSVPDLGEDEDEDLTELAAGDDDVVVLVDDAIQASVEAEPVPETEVTGPEPVAAEAIAEVEAPVAPRPEPAVASDFSQADDAELAAALETQLAEDPRVVFFAGQWMVEDKVDRLGRNDVRRIKDYISEQEQPLTDATLVQDILNVRPNSTSFDSIQFSLNYRLFKDHRDFDFVGTNDQRFWSISSLPQIGTTRRKPNEIGTDYRYLVDETPADVAHRSVRSITRVVTFYEHSLGLLPYDEEMQKLLPAPVLPEQRSAVLTFEIPHLYTTYLVELRYPTPNRGGFLLGLDDLYAEGIVPGAMISITATDNDGHYVLEVPQGKDQSVRLLDLDDRRTPRYHFRPTTFTCEVAPEWLISEDRFPRLGNEKPLDDRIRRRPDAVVEATFERIGIEDGDSLISTFDELLAVANVERPFSEQLLRETLEASTKVTSEGDDTYTYVR